MRILHLEDDPHDAELIRLLLRTEWPDCRIECVASADVFRAAVERGGFDVIVSDVSLPGFDGFTALRIAKSRTPDIPFIFVSGTIGEDRAIQAVRLGADDYILKDRMKRLVTAITRAMRDAVERSERRLQETRIREQAEMLNQAREAIFIADVSGRILYWNAGAERMLGWRAAEVVGRNMDELMPAGLPAVLRAARPETLQSGGWCGEVQLHNAAGEPLVVESRQTLIRHENGDPKARLCINTDITERKRLEEQFLRAQRMENLGLLAAGIAHDLNNTLAPILLATPMLRDYVQAASGVKLLDTLEKSAERGALLVRQILSFAHGVGGEHQLLQVKHLLRDIGEVITGTFPKSLRLEEYVPSDLWPIKGNPTQIHQVLLNLTVNARDAMPAGGTLTLRGENRVLRDAEAASIPGARAGAFLVMHVEDTGTGIPLEVLPRIWEPFFTTKDAGRGTGLGLSTVRGIVEAHHGFIHVTSSPGEGSCFRVYLPAAETGLPELDELALRSSPRGNGELILVVDDEQQIREITSAVLGKYGYRVLLACDGVEAMTIFTQRAAEIRLVISDLHMPNLDGAMLARAVRRISPDAKLLVVSGMASGLGHRLKYHPDDFSDALLLKPFRPEALLEQVERLLHSSDPADATVA